MELHNQDLNLSSGVSAVHIPCRYPDYERREKTYALKKEIESVVKAVSHAQELSTGLQRYTQDCYAKHFCIINNKLEEVFCTLAYIKTYLDFRTDA